MELTLSPQLDRYVEEQVRSGRFASASELVAHALGVLVAKDAKDVEYLRERLRLAEEDIAEGRLIPADDAFFDALRERVRTMARRFEAERETEAERIAVGSR